MNRHGKCIFLVDDNAIYLNMGKAALKDNYTVITIPSGEKLLHLLEGNKPDLILLDVEMAGMSGYEVIEKIKANPETKDIPVIFLTVKYETEDELLGLTLGAVDYITKPFSQSLLLKRVELHLMLEEQKRDLREFNSNLLEMVKERTRDVTELQNAFLMWSAEVIEHRDEKTGEHVERVQKYLDALLDAMKERGYYADDISEWDTDAFLKSAVLHDIGKIKISDSILLKPDLLTEEERAIMQSHTVFGKKLLQSLQEKLPNQIFLEYAEILAYSHHERWDGAGYPDGLRGSEIPLQARMMALADVYDALISERPYKKAFSHKEAIDIISVGSGEQFDPIMDDLFVSIADEIERVNHGKPHFKWWFEGDNES